MKSRTFNVLKNLAFLALGIIILILAFRGVDMAKLIDKMLAANFLWIIVAKCFPLVAHIVRAARWNLLIAPLGFRPPLKNSFYAVMIGYLTNLAVPRLGEFMRCWSLQKTNDVPVAPLLGTVVVERTIDVIVLFLIIIGITIVKLELLGSFLVKDLLTPFVERIENILSQILTNTSYLIIAGIILLAGMVLMYLAYQRIRKSQRVKGIFIGFADGLKAIFQLKRKKTFLFYTVFMWLLYIVGFYVHFFAMEATANLGFVNSIMIFALSTLSMMAPVQHGLGVVHWLIANGLVLLNLTMEEGLAFATIVHASAVLFLLLVGAISLVIVLMKKPFKIT